MNEEDPILEVTGIAAAEILARCARIRAGQGGISVGGLSHSLSGIGRVGAEPVRGRTAWRLADFGRGNNEDFVHMAYIALLGRAATQKEVTRRLRQLAAGKTRLGILARLMFSRESRKHHPKVRGVTLSILKKTARYCHKKSRKIARMPWAGKILKGFYLILSAVQKVPIIGQALDILIALPTIGRMRRDIMELKAQIRRLNAREER